MISPRTVARRTQRSSAVSVAAPIGGLNARDSLGDMDKLDAVTLTNWWPGTSSVILRKGYTKFATNITGQVESLMNYSSGTSEQFFAAANTSVYNVTAGGTIGAASLAGVTNARWQYINFTTTGGSYMMMVNGADKLRIWDGSAWHTDGSGSPYNITNVDTSTCINITAFKNRVWLIQKNTLVAWYLPVNAIGGAAASLDMSSVAQQGGYLMAAMEWTIDAGYGVDDYLAFITSNGETLVWRLTDPTDPSGISLIGLWSLGSPIGRRCWIKYAGDLLLITQDGIVPMSSALQSSRLNARVSITDKIQYAVSTAITSYGGNFGWQLLTYPKGNQLYLNVPVAEGQTQQQYVQNNITKAWCNFTGWAANCWELFNDEPYFGGNGFVGRAWDGATDDVSAIQSLVIQAFRAYGGASQKQCKMVRFHFASNGFPAVYGNVNVDFDLQDHAAQLSTSPTSFARWDSAVWDIDAWSPGNINLADWQGATGIGYTFAPFLKTSTFGLDLQWTSTDMVFEQGGTI